MEAEKDVNPRSRPGQRLSIKDQDELMAKIEADPDNMDLLMQLQEVHRSLSMVKPTHLNYIWYCELRNLPSSLTNLLGIASADSHRITFQCLQELDSEKTVEEGSSVDENKVEEQAAVQAGIGRASVVSNAAACTRIATHAETHWLYFIDTLQLEYVLESYLNTPSVRCCAAFLYGDTWE
jgi:hypothetical protein